MVGLHSLNDLWVHSEFLEYLSPYFHMSSLNFVVDCFAYIMKQCGFLGCRNIQPQLCGEHSRYVGHFYRVKENILPETGSERQSAKQVREFGIHRTYAGLKQRRLTGLFYIFVYLTLCF